MNKKGRRGRFLNLFPLWGPNPESCSSGSWLLTSDSWSRIQLAGMALLFVLVPPGVVRAGAFQPRVQIPNVVQVGGEVVKLSDLLPPDAPGEVREICRRVILGNAPFPASLRVISRVQIAAPLREFPSTLEQLEIPDRVIVTRQRRRLSAAEIRTAIETSTAREELPGFRTLNLNGLNLQAPVFVTKPDPGLEVKRVEPDRVERKTRFLLWTSKEPQVLPFYVTVEGLPETAGGVTGSPGLRGGSSARATTHTGESTQQATSSPIVLVAAGKPAKLVVETATLRITALVTPLESGVQGQIIRVRNQDTQRVLKAEVVGRGLLEAELGGE
jgi:hypothetical protein